MMANKTENKPKKGNTQKAENKKHNIAIDTTTYSIQVLSQVYDKDYFENGKATGKSNYFDYSWHRLGTYFQNTAKHIVDKFSPASALDVGCAKGFLVKALTDLGVNAYGIDPSEYAIGCVPEDIKSRISQGIAQSLPYPDNNFDIVICFDVLEHIPEDDVLKVLQEMLRVTKKWLALRVVTKDLPDDVDSSHKSIHDKDWWIEKIKEAGGAVEPTENYVNNGTWWFNVPEFLNVARKAGE